LLKSLDLEKVVADHKLTTKLIPVKTSAASASVCTTQNEVADSGCKVEALQFLSDASHELEQLRKYPVVAECLPRSTPVFHRQHL